MQEMDQLIGRLNRPPQTRTVHVYSLLLRDCVDEMLHRLCQSKGFIHEAFVNDAQKYRTSACFLLLPKQC